jgi:peroxiredoxin Q/BCP
VSKKSLLMSLAAALVAMSAAVFAIVSVHAADDAAMPAAGQAAPAFTLPSQDGSPISLSQYKGKWVVLYFYPRDMTPGCTVEAHKFQDSLSQFEAKNAVILGVSVDSSDSHKQFCAKDGLTFHLLSDISHSTVSAYGSLGSFGDVVIANRNTFLIGPDGKIKQVWVKVNPTESASEVLSAIP